MRIKDAENYRWSKIVVIDHESAVVVLCEDGHGRFFAKYYNASHANRPKQLIGLSREWYYA